MEKEPRRRQRYWTERSGIYKPPAAKRRLRPPRDPPPNGVGEELQPAEAGLLGIGIRASK